MFSYVLGFLILVVLSFVVVRSIIDIVRIVKERKKNKLNNIENNEKGGNE